SLILTTHHSIFLLTISPPPTSTLFPYTTLFRSSSEKSANQKSTTKNYFAAGSFSFSNLSRMPVAASIISGSTLRLLETASASGRSEEHTSELQSHLNLVCRLLLEKKKKI